MTPREAFEKGAEHYDIKLGSMSNHPESFSDDFWIYEEGEVPGGRIGYIPSHEIKARHDQDAGDVSYLEMFSMDKWARFGKKLIGIPVLKNDKDQELCHGSIIDFSKRPVNLVPTDALLFWLAV